MDLAFAQRTDAEDDDLALDRIELGLAAAGGRKQGDKNRCGNREMYHAEVRRREEVDSVHALVATQ